MILNWEVGGLERGGNVVQRPLPGKLDNLNVDGLLDNNVASLLNPLIGIIVLWLY